MATGKAGGQKVWTSVSNTSLFLWPHLSSPSPHLLVSMGSLMRPTRIREGAALQGVQCAHCNQRGYASRRELRDEAQTLRHTIRNGQQKQLPHGTHANDNLHSKLTARMMQSLPDRTLLICKTLKLSFASPCDRPAAFSSQHRLRPATSLNSIATTGNCATKRKVRATKIQRTGRKSRQMKSAQTTTSIGN